MTNPKIAGYPAEYEADVLLKDGSTIRMRPIRPDDDEAMIAAFYWRQGCVVVDARILVQASES